MISHLLIIIPKITEKHKNLFDRNIIRIISSFIPSKIDETTLKLRIKNICENKIYKVDIDWLLRFYKYYSGQFININHNRDDVKKGSFNDTFDTLFENSLYKLKNKTISKKKISTDEIETEFHPFIFFNTREVDFGRGPRLRKTHIL